MDARHQLARAQSILLRFGLSEAISHWPKLSSRSIDYPRSECSTLSYHGRRVTRPPRREEREPGASQTKGQFKERPFTNEHSFPAVAYFRCSVLPGA